MMKRCENVMASKNGFFTLPLTSTRGEKIDCRAIMKADF
jgi:hypothetical protein